MKKLAPILGAIYFGIGLIYALYSNFFGAYQYKSLVYNIGRGLIWPATMFPSFGKFLGGLIILAVIGALTVKR
ncbi:hypothetical protein [Faucicola atlantae]|uniref:Uncharacterized protein n=1 Tax=Faucicola atlantae TaxID=34059 RepID=A0A1B8QA31_9GAMM|nr:hypothetical protein [Moraxella atlantae]OBX75971.1 hypothetical protein A9306_01780 [Moraxella atlantae]